MQLTFNDSQVDVQNMPGNQGKMIVVVDKQGNVVIIPLPAESARKIGAALSSSLLVASGPMPSNGKAGLPQ